MKLPLFVLVLFARAVLAGDLLWPLPGHTTLTGGFADSRPDHFHGGVDLRTLGEHVPVVAPADGWIERIAVTPPGYGRTLYYRLTDGRTAVFAHLSRFAPALETMLRDSELVVGTYRVDNIYDAPAAARQFHRGDTLAYSGDTGIGPPHFHFEMREGAVEVDPLQDFTNRAVERADLLGVSWVKLSECSPSSVGMPLKNTRHDGVLDFGVIESNEPVAFFARADMANSFGRRGAPKATRVKLNGQTIFEEFPTRVDLLGPRDIYRRIVLEGEAKSGRDLRRLFDQPGPPQADSAESERGWISSVNHATVEIEVEDRASKVTHGRIIVSAGPWPSAAHPDSPREVRAGDFSLEAGDDYALAWMQMENVGPNEIVISPTGNGLEDRHVLRFDGPRDSQKKYYFYERTARGYRPLSSTTCDSAGLYCNILRSGTYGVAEDNVPPRMILTVRRDGLHFRLTDGESGIDDSTIRCMVDNQTAIAEFEYEARGGMIWTREPLTRGEHRIHFTAADRAGNVGTWDQTLRTP